ncbi:tyrosine-type recombinase/integrase [Halocynthiibacter styelae]|uniref:Site-specific integrase n=1 Tax=Halocynthiibacter styelae TaxID=2761955 RepID=A0A8J7IMQ1_9RHOB|nr:site-specific integrase [Paenihalocynthiibacter styelae]MBI1493516.1 site-specific integrase [Paenihalocynthiibacter styelae]
MDGIGYINDAFAQLRVSEITAEMVQTFLSDLSESLSGNTVRGLFSKLRVVLDLALKRGWLKVDPLAGHRISLPPKERREAFPDRGQIGKILEFVNSNDHLNQKTCAVLLRRVYFNLAIFAGLRSGEIGTLEWDAVDLDTDTITVRQSCSKIDGITKPKTKAGNRKVPMSGRIKAALLEMLAYQQLQAKTMADATSPNNKSWLINYRWKYGMTPDLDAPRKGLIFKRGAQGLFHAEKIRQGLYMPVMEALGMTGEGKPDFPPHSLRHAAASLFIEAAVQPMYLKTIMGHGSIMITYDVYGHLFPTDNSLRDAIAQIGATFDATTERQRNLSACN